MKQITFKEQVTVEQLEQRAKDGECVALVSSEGDCIWYSDNMWSCTYGFEVETAAVIDESWIEQSKSWTDTKTQLPVATGDVIHFSELEPGDVVEYVDHTGDKQRDMVGDVIGSTGFRLLIEDCLIKENTSLTFHKLDLPPLNQPKEGVLRYKTLEELERDHYKDEDGNYYKNDSLHSLKFTKEMQAHACGKPSANSVWINQPWMTTTDPLT